LRVALDTAGNQVAVGIAAELDPRHDVIEAPPRRGSAAEAVEAEPPLAGVDGLAERASLQEVCTLEIEGRRRSGRDGRGAAGGDRGATRARSGDLARQADLNEMAGFGAFHEAQNTESRETADGFAHGSSGDADGAGEPLNGEAKARLCFEAAMAQEMGIDGPVEDGKAQPGNQNIFHLLPDLHGVDRFKFHVIFQKGKAAGLAAPQEAGAHPDKRGRAQFQREDAAAQDRGFGRPSREIQKPLGEVPRDAGTGKSREARTSCRAQPAGDRRTKKQTFSDGGSAPKKREPRQDAVLNSWKHTPL
jgi:hypothetical protein